MADPEYQAHGYRTFGYRTGLAVPLQREGTNIGTFTLTRDEVRPFTDKQIELVTTFADQAVIAIENARLLTELRDSLEQQTASAEVLGVISTPRRATSSRCLRACVENAIRICDAKFGNIYRWDGDAWNIIAATRHSRHRLPNCAEARRFAPARRQPSRSQTLATKAVVHIARRPYGQKVTSSANR